MDFKLELAKLVADITKKDVLKVKELIEVPKDLNMGDFALPCFMFAKELKKPPIQIVNDLAAELSGDWFVVERAGSYLNFKIKQDFLAKNILTKIVEPMIFENEGGKTIGIESPSPNSNKPLHLGHARNMLLGLSLKNIYEKTGNKVIWFDLVNDKGVHICKSMLAYKLLGEGKTPESEGIKSDLFVGNYYVEFSNLEKENPAILDDAKQMLVLWEAGDAKTIELWKLMCSWWLEGVKVTYDDYNVKVDVRNFESEIYKEGKKIVLDALDKGIFQKDETGAIYIDLEDEGLGVKYLLRADGTSIYMTQDIYLAKKRFEEHKLDEFRYIVGSEQKYHFNTLFSVLGKLGFDFANKCTHVSYGLIYLPDGKMKSREGNVVDADAFRQKMLELSEVELKNRYSELGVVELERRKNIIATGAVNFFILKYDSHKDFTYFPDKALSFQGESGPYIQYAHARICSILRKEKPSISSLESLQLISERALINKLGEYRDVVFYAASSNKPSVVTNYLLELAQLFNSYYQEVPILKADADLKNARLFLIDKVRIIFSDGLALLGIVAPEEM
ncbi:MAG: arginine--tRNA ligase [Candidatus Woesearchaeota archaeon]